MSKTKGLHISVCAAHRKEHFGFGAQNAGTHLKLDFNFGSLGDIRGKFQQSSCKGELMQFRWNTPKTFQLNQGCNISPQTNAGSARSGAWLGRVSHQ